MRRSFVVVGLSAVLSVSGLVAVVAQSGSRQVSQAHTTWSAYLGNADSSQWSGLTQINRQNVSTLKVAWTFPSGNRAFMFSPLVADGLIYVLAGANELTALDAATGTKVWGRAHPGAVGTRGINYWRSADGKDQRLLYIAAGHITAVNAKTGQPIPSFGINGSVDLRIALRESTGRAFPDMTPLQTANPGRVFEDLFIIPLPAQGTSYDSNPGDVHAYDVRTGRLRWVFHSIPHAGEVGAETWPRDAWKTHGGVHNWSELTIDEGRGIAFVPFGTGRFDFYGGDRPGNNLFANSLVALDARTGKRLWHFQTVHHDVWDYDLPAAPRLLTLTRNGRRQDVVAQTTKQGFLFVFDRVTGAPVWPIEERPVPQSDVPGERTSPTQPFPTKPAPYIRQSFTEKDINPYLPAADREAFRARIRSYRNEGLFTPPSFQGSVQFPGHGGGANWGSAAVDAARGEIYVLAKSLPTMLRVQPLTAAGTPLADATRIVSPDEVARLKAQGAEALTKGSVPYVVPYNYQFDNAYHMTPIGPPWAEIVAYDLNTGDIKWRVPHGSVTAPASVGIPERSGAHWPRGGLVATAGGLLFGATSSDRTLWAYDRADGKVVWKTTLPAASEGVPATYEVNGRQFLVVPVAAQHGWNPTRFPTLPPPPPGSYVAYALP
jgi:quinoprotein glucose dehydrogenase